MKKKSWFFRVLALLYSFFVVFLSLLPGSVSSKQSLTLTEWFQQLFSSKTVSSMPEVPVTAFSLQLPTYLNEQQPYAFSVTFYPANATDASYELLYDKESFILEKQTLRPIQSGKSSLQVCSTRYSVCSEEKTVYIKPLQLQSVQGETVFHLQPNQVLALDWSFLPAKTVERQFTIEGYDPTILSFQSPYCIAKRSGVTKAVVRFQRQITKEVTFYVGEKNLPSPVKISMDVPEILYENHHYTVTPQSVPQESAAFFSIEVDHPTVLSIDQTTLHAKRAGETMVTWTSLVDTNITFQKKITILPAHIEDFSLLKKNKYSVGDRFFVEPTIQTTLEHPILDFRYHSDQETIASISRTGEVLLKKPGKATIYVKENTTEIEKQLVIQVDKNSRVSAQDTKTLHRLIRKGIGHFSLFGGLAVVTFLALKTFPTFTKKQKNLFGILYGIAFAFLSEFAQAIPGGRYPTIEDVFLNVLGYAVCFYFLLLLSMLQIKKSFHKPPSVSTIDK